MEIIMAIGGKIAEYTVAPIGRQFGYLIDYNTNLDNLKVQLQKLEDLKARVRHSIDTAKRNGEDIEDNVQRWLKQVDEVVAEANKFHEHAKPGCSNLCSRRHLSRKATHMAQAISKVASDGKFDRVSFRPLHLPVTVTASARGYEALASRTSMLQEIMKALKHENMYLVGVYGMGGVGKTKLVKELAWQAEKERALGVVAMATVTNSPNVRKIQGEIADQLGLKFDEETEAGRASRLRERMKKEESILVILDDIWERLDLVEVGIPFGEDHRGCKLLLTSRNADVLRTKMGTQKEFRLEVLSEDESWKLFKKIAGEIVDDDENLQPTALAVAEQCAGLPLLLVTVANTLKNKELLIWKDALKQLTRVDHEGFKSKLYSAIELSYNYLETDELRKFFLFVASFGNGHHSTYDLLIYGWSLGLYKGIDTLADARNRVYALTSGLRASCLLLEGERDWIEMHDSIHEVACDMAFKAKPFFSVRRYGELREWPKNDSLETRHGVFLPWCYIEELPKRLECPQLEILVLDSMDNYLKVPDNFLVMTKEVKVLDLGGFDCCPSLPKSLSFLTNLRALYLCQCMLEDITMVGQLRNLEILNLDKSELKEFPKEIGELTRLRLLDLTDCSGLKVIPSNVLSSLICLEELYMWNCFIEWEAEGSSRTSHSQSSNASLGELRNLHKLTALKLQIQDASVFPRDLFIFGRLESYEILIGHKWKWSQEDSDDNHGTSRTLYLDLSMVAAMYLDRGIKMLLNNVEDLYLANLEGVTNILYHLNTEGFPQLKRLHVQNSDEMKFIIDSTERIQPSPAFMNLESLVLCNLINMEKISHGLFPIQSFSKLKVIKVMGCERLRNLCVFEMVRDLCNIVEVEISECKSMTEIVVADDDGKEFDNLNLPKLRSLTLDCLPMLASLYSKSSSNNIKSRNGVANYKVASSIPAALLDDKIELPNLESLNLSSLNMNIIWDDQLSAHSCIQNLITLSIENCENLKHLFSYSVARGLVKLQYLKITRCNRLEEIFAPETNMSHLPNTRRQIWNEEATFPRLEALVICHMDGLKSVWKTQMAPNSFGKLKQMEISFCKKLSILFPSHVQSHLSNLETLTVSCCDAMEVILETQGSNSATTSHGRRLANELRTLSLNHLPKLNHVFPLSLVKELLQLQEFHVANCGVENIIVAEDNNTEKAAPRLVFPRLTSLTFWELEKLKTFYSGIHTLDCPKLEKLYVYHCDKLQAFMPRSQDCPENMVEQPLFPFDKVISNIEEISLSSKDVKRICNGQLSLHGDLYSVKALQLQCFHNESDKFPFSFLQRFNNLESLTVSCSLFQEIFSSEISDNEFTETSPCNEKSNMQHIQSHRTSGEQDFPSLKNYLTSSLQLQNLDTLFLYKCDRLINLMTSSTARSFLSLKKLMIHDCKAIGEVVNSDDDGEIAFMKLERLELSSLSNLTSFCRGNHNFKFPLLRTIFVVECPKMKTFSKRILRTPMLRRVKMTWERNGEWHWHRDLNTTIGKMFKETVISHDLQI